MEAFLHEPAPGEADPSPGSTAGGWFLLMALVKVVLVGLALLFLRVRTAAPAP